MHGSLADSMAGVNPGTSALASAFTLGREVGGSSMGVWVRGGQPEDDTGLHPGGSPTNHLGDLGKSHVALSGRGVKGDQARSPVRSPQPLIS